MNEIPHYTDIVTMVQAQIGKHAAEFLTDPGNIAFVQATAKDYATLLARAATGSPETQAKARKSLDFLVAGIAVRAAEQGIVVEQQANRIAMAVIETALRALIEAIL